MPKEKLGQEPVKTTDQEDIVLAEGVDEDPIEKNRRLFKGGLLSFMTILATIYAAFHMVALNGLSLSAITGISIDFLPEFPLETWNFRMVHVAGALILGFLLFNARFFLKKQLLSQPH